ncbi:MAG: sigma-70 family RNA polymerase sigma factor [Gemmatimonadetes bacterium]|nr:sigma-70 family RNA polymerase sigma factor [Gemmatimonadota bacterium]
MGNAREEITQLLRDMSGGDGKALDELLPLVYRELRAVAHNQLKSERSGHTLGTTALVHEAYIKLVDQNRVEWKSRGHFFAVASMAMRRILVNYAKERKRLKRGGGVEKISLDAGLQVAVDGREDELVALDDALDKLGAIDERAARVVECRFFGGLTIDETGEALDIAPMTVKRSWTFAKTWLKRAMA